MIILCIKSLSDILQYGIMVQNILSFKIVRKKDQKICIAQIHPFMIYCIQSMMVNILKQTYIVSFNQLEAGMGSDFFLRTGDIVIRTLLILRIVFISYHHGIIWMWIIDFVVTVWTQTKWWCVLWYNASRLVQSSFQHSRMKRKQSKQKAR